MKSDSGAAAIEPMPIQTSGQAAAPRRARAPLIRRLTWLDGALLILVVLACGFLFYRVSITLRYHWNWRGLLPYIFFYDQKAHHWVANLLLNGFITTIRMSIWSSILAAVVGVVIAYLQISRILLLRLLGRSYVELIRNIPALVFIFIFYFFISNQIVSALGADGAAAPITGWVAMPFAVLFGPQQLLPNFISGVLCLGLLEAAYVAEIVRAGIESVPKGQWQAGKALGLRPSLIMRHLVLPQAIRKVLPPLASQFITLIKSSSIVSLISIQELTFNGSELASSSGLVFESWITVACLYFILCFSLSLLFRHFEARHRAANS
ncbi:amino acid ABC transporter permease [Caballeronia sp. dw_19]|uniref:amino acid ABC transporter permease n=1 Tax=Caballeronia sp. dw_19 TaxID=2719791 RepID=UPI001BD1D9D8|nr:amino acid ABC transporter permease [Caballeronia sp. dw_19]